MTDEEERQLHVRMVEGAVAAGFTELVFKAHPGAPAGLTAPLVRRAEELGARLTVRETPELVETWYASGEVDLVVGCFSTALATAALYGVPAARLGTELLLERLNPYENSNRIPAAVIAATVPPLAGAAGRRPEPSRPLTTEQVVNTVGYLMQPTRNPDLRERRSQAARAALRRPATLCAPATAGPARPPGRPRSRDRRPARPGRTDAEAGPGPQAQPAVGQRRPVRPAPGTGV